jgi:hypothetical protein
MKGLQDKRHRKKQDLQVLPPFPGCLGRVINVFDLGNGVVATKMLTEKAHRDGTGLSYTSSSMLLSFCKKNLFLLGLGFFFMLCHDAWHGCSFSTKNLMQCSMRFAVSPAGKDRSNTFKTAINPPVQTEAKQVRVLFSFFRLCSI